MAALSVDRNRAGEDRGAFDSSPERTTGPAVASRSAATARTVRYCSFALGMAGQVAYHLLDQADVARAPWAVTTIVSCLPVLVLAMGTALAHMLCADAADGPDSRSAGPESPRSPAWSPRTSPDQTRTVPQGPGNRRKSDRSRAKTDAPASDTQGSGPPATGYARLVAAKLAAAGKPVSRRALRSAGARESNQALNALAREINAGLTSGADNRLSTTAPRCREGP